MHTRLHSSRLAPAALPSLALAALLPLLSSCIERPYDGTAATRPRQEFDRSSVRDALVTQLPADTVPVGALFGGGAVELLGYRIEPTALVPEQRARLTLYWRCRKPLDNWRIFVHLDDATSQTPERINGDHDPVQGRFPTEAWRPNDVIADPILFTVGHVPLALFLGFYSGDNRLPLDSPGRGRDDGNNRLWAGNLNMAK